MLQTTLALMIVAAAAAWQMRGLLSRWVRASRRSGAKSAETGCGNCDCGS